MKEIELRLYDKSQGRMIYSNFINEPTGKREWHPFEFPIGFSHYDLEDFSEIMLFTGLYDKNRTKIFEGDIVRLNNQIGSIVYEAGSFGIGIKEYIDYESLSKLSRSKTSNYYDGIGCDNFISLLEIYWNFNCNDCLLDDIEVIGNIYDNPELLED